MTVSIVIPYSLSYRDFLREALDSAYAQTVRCEIIFAYYGNKPFNVSAARNRGIEKAQGEYILPLDADDKLDPTFIEKTLPLMHQGTAIVTTGLRAFGRGCFTHMPVNPTYESVLKQNSIHACSLFRKSVWQEVNGYDESMTSGYEDWDLWTRILQKGYRCAVVPEYLFFYRKHGASLIDTAVQHHDELASYIRQKHLEVKV